MAHPVRSCIRFAVPLALVAFALPAAAQSQDRTTAERLDRIERDMNMLQRQVYRGAPTAMSVNTDPGAAANVEVRVERVEAQMRDLTGRVEEVANGLEQLKQRVEQINSDIDVRLGQGAEAGAAAPPPPARPGAARQPGEPGRIAGAGSPPPGTVVPPPGAGNPSGGLNPIFNTLSPPGSGGPPPAAPAPASAPADTAPGGGLPSGTPAHQFNYAFGLVKQADYPGAETALRAFIREHPGDPLAGNAHFWLGETYYQRGKYVEAASAYAEGYKRFPKGSKAADDLLKLAMALAHTDQKKNACVALAQLDQAFPHPGAAIRDRANAEKKRVGCS